jgi:hypothetical protein
MPPKACATIQTADRPLLIQGFAPVVPFAAAVVSGATGPATPRILVTLLLPVFAIHTLPPRSTAIPPGVDNSVGSIIPPEGEITDAEFENRLNAPLPSVTHT